MVKLHPHKGRPFFFLFIISCCFIITTASIFLIEPSNQPNDLDVLLLNKDAAPTFHLTSQLTYTPELVDAWTTAPVASLTQSTTPTLENDTLHLYIPLEKISLTSDTFIKDLDALNQVFPHIFLSLMPASDMTDTTYLDQCQLLHTALLLHPNLDISMIVYPLSSQSLSLYNQNFIDGIGTVLSEDFERLNALYDFFVDKKTLYIRDEIKDFYGVSQVNQAAQAITATYYNLAINYPGVDTIFSPFITSQRDYQDPYFLNRKDESYYLFYTVYNRLLEKNWLTTGKEKVASVSPYVPLKSYDLLSGEVEIVLNPRGDLLSHLATLKASTKESYGISFKWNTSNLPVASGYPYGVTLDTDTVPNGISRLKAILQDGQGNVLEVHSLDLTVKHPITQARATRIKSAAVPAPKDTEVERGYIPILMYHTVEDTVLPESQNSCVETKNFDAQMKALVENGYTPINFSDLKDYLEGTVLLPEHPVLITMDDGYLNNYTKAYPIYKKYGIQATLFVSPYYVAENNTMRHFGWTAAKEMEASGLIDIQSHGYDHTPFPSLSVENLKHHITLSKSIIEQHLGPRDVWVVACPQFRNNMLTRKVLASLGVDFQITSLAKKGTVLSPTSLKRINVPNTMTPEELIATLDQLTS